MNLYLAEISWRHEGKSPRTIFRTRLVYAENVAQAREKIQKYVDGSLDFPHDVRIHIHSPIE